MVSSIFIIKLIVFLDLFGVSLIIPLTPGYARKLGASNITVGLLGSIYAGFQLFSGPLFGSLSDLKDRRIVLMVTLIVCAAAYTAKGMSTSIVSLLCLRAVLGVFKQTQMLTRAMVPDYEKLERRQSKIYGEMAAISSVGFTMGPFVGGHIEEADPENGYKYIAMIVGVCYLINAGLVYCLPQPQNRHRKKESMNNSSLNIFKLVSSSLSQSVVLLTKVRWLDYWDVFLLKALIAFAMGVFFSTYSFYLQSMFDLSPKEIGYVISSQGVVGSCCSYFIGFINKFYVKDSDYSLRNIHVFLLGTLALLGLALSDNIYWYSLWLIPLAMSNAVGRLVTLEVVLKRSHGKHRGTLIGASHSVRSLTGVVAPMVGGLIAHYCDLSYVIYASMISMLIGVGVSYYIRYYKKIKIH